MADKDQVISTLRATLLSCKGTLTLKQCNRDYKELQGEWIPYEKLGYSSLEKLFLEIPGFRVSRSTGEWRVDAVASQETEHIANLVSKQKSAPPRKPMGRNYQMSRFPKSSGSWRSPQMSNVRLSNNSPHYNQKGGYFSPKGKNYKSPSQVNSSNTNYKPGQMPYNHYNQQTKNVPNRYQNQALKHLELVAKIPPLIPLVPASPSQKTVPNQNQQPKQQQNQQPKQQQTKQQQTTKGSSPPETKNGEAKPEKGRTKPASTTRMSAFQRMHSLREKLNVTEQIALPLPAAANDITIIRQEPEVIPFKEPDLPEPKTPKERLEWLCKRLRLPEPVYKGHTIRPKHGPPSYDCTVKVGTQYTGSSYPDSAPTADLALAAAAAKVLNIMESNSEIISHYDGSGTPLPPSVPEVAIERIVHIVSQHIAGVWANNIPKVYKETFAENLPSNWQNLVESCPRIMRERAANGTLILLPNVSEGTISPHNSEASISSEQSDAPLPPLQFPDEAFWNVFVTVANSTIEVWLRIIGEQYSDALETLLADMELYYTNDGSPVTTVIEDAWYAVKLDECGWQRAKALESKGSHTLVFLADHGDEELVPVANLRLLAPNFCLLPAQAILCSLVGLEEMAGAPHGIDVLSSLVGKVLVAEPSFENSSEDDPGMRLVLHDTSTDLDINMNRALLASFCTAAKPVLLSQHTAEVEVTCVSDEGRVWVACNATGRHTVRAALALLSEHPPTIPPAPPLHNTLYALQTPGGEWLRCCLRQGADENGAITVQLTDSGQVVKTSASNLILLESLSPALNAYPPQAIQVKLSGVEVLPGPLVERVRQLLLGRPVLCRAVAGPSGPGATPAVEFFVRTQPQNILASVNNAINIEWDMIKAGQDKNLTTDKGKTTVVDTVAAFNRKKERIFSRTVTTPLKALADVSTDVTDVSLQRGAQDPLPPLIVPEVGAEYDVYVSMAANPWNFVVQPYQSTLALKEMMSQLQVACTKLPVADTLLNPQPGEVYALLYNKDNMWYRVTVVGAVSEDMVSVNFCDFGDLALVSKDDLRPLPAATVPTARSLPPQAIRACLYGVSPKHHDWSVEDCVRFQELTVDQKFVSIVKKVGTDRLHPNEPLLTLDLVDTSTEKDLFINQQLITEERAVAPKKENQNEK